MTVISDCLFDALFMVCSRKPFTKEKRSSAERIVEKKGVVSYGYRANLLQKKSVRPLIATHRHLMNLVYSQSVKRALVVSIAGLGL